MLAVQQSAPVSLAVARPRRKVLLCDEDLGSRQARAAALRRAGLDVVCAAKPDEARFLFRPGMYALVLADFSDRAAALQLCADLLEGDSKQLVAFLVGTPPYLVLPRHAAEFVPRAELPKRSSQTLTELVASVNRDAGYGGSIRHASRLISLLHFKNRHEKQ